MGEIPFGYVLPSDRWHIERSWWIAAELAWRLPGRVITEVAGGGGDQLCVVPMTPHQHGVQVRINRGGTIRVEEWAETNQVREIHAVPSWEAFARPPLELVRELVAAVESDPAFDRRDEGGAEMATKAQFYGRGFPWDPRVLSYLFISCVLSLRVSSANEWDCRSFGGGVANRRELERFDRAYADARDLALEGWEYAGKEQHFWALTRDHEPVAIVSDLGRVYVEDGDVHEILAVAWRHSGIMRSVAGEILLDALDFEEPNA